MGGSGIADIAAGGRYPGKSGHLIGLVAPAESVRRARWGKTRTQACDGREAFVKVQ